MIEHTRREHDVSSSSPKAIGWPTLPMPTAVSFSATFFGGVDGVRMGDKAAAASVAAVVPVFERVSRCRHAPPPCAAVANACVREQSYSMVDGTRGMQSLLISGDNIRGQRDAGDVVQFVNSSGLRYVMSAAAGKAEHLARSFLPDGGGGENGGQDPPLRLCSKCSPPSFSVRLILRTGGLSSQCADVQDGCPLYRFS